MFKHSHNLPSASYVHSMVEAELKLYNVDLYHF